MAESKIIKHVNYIDLGQINSSSVQDFLEQAYDALPAGLSLARVERVGVSHYQIMAYKYASGHSPYGMMQAQGIATRVYYVAVTGGTLTYELK